jgi:magnesium-transporting ATPase (P-type)
MKSVMEQEQTQKKYISDTRFWIVWGTIAGIILLGGLFYGWKIWALSQENARFETSIENTSARLKALAPGSEQLIKKRTEALHRAENFRTNWASVFQQVTELETTSARFSTINISGPKVSASCQTTSWQSFAAFVKKLETDPRIKNLRISSTRVLSPPIAGAKQAAELTFDFSPTES